MKLLISLYDHSGNQSQPYKQNGWIVKRVDIKYGIDILNWHYRDFYYDLIKIASHYDDEIEKIGIICATPCTDYAISGAKHFARKDSDGSTELSQRLVKKNKEIIYFFKETGKLQFHQTENPMSRIHKLNPWMGEVKFKFNPCDFSGYFEMIYDNEFIQSARSKENFNDLTRTELDALFYFNLYNKATWLWGEFNNPAKHRIEPIFKENPGFKLYGGKSERTKELRSVTPMGFCWAFYEANH